MIPVIYMIIYLAFGIMAIGFATENRIILLFSSFILMPLSIYIFVNGLDAWSNFVTTSFAAVTLGIGAYVGIRNGLDLVED